MRGIFVAVALAAASFTSAASAATVAQNQSFNDVARSGSYYLGQSFTVTGAGTFNTVAVNFYGETGNAVAPGTLFLYSSAFGGTVAQLGSASATFLGSATGAGGVYSFAPSLTLSGGAQYFAYSNAASPVLQFHNGDPYGGGLTYQASGNTSATYSTVGPADLRFLVTASQGPAGVPEPTTWAMMLLGFGAMGAVARYRRRTTKFAYA